MKLFFKKLTQKVVYVFLCIVILVLSSCNNKKTIEQYNKKTEDKIVVSVNDENIYESQLQNVIKQSLDNPIDRSFLIENSINQLVVVQFGKKMDIFIEDEYFETYIENYKKQYPEYFQRGIEIYGEDEFLKGLRYHLIYKETKNKIISEKFSDIYVSSDVLKAYLKEKKHNITLSEDNFNTIKDKYIQDTQEALFDNWVKEIRADYQINYYQ